MKKILTLTSFTLSFVVMYGFFVYTVFADNNISGIPGTTLLSAEGDCARREAEIDAKYPDPVLDLVNRTKAKYEIQKKCYQFLEPLPVIDENGKEAEATAISIEPTGSIGKSFNNFYDVAIALGSVLAVIMITLYGFRYMTGEKGGYDKQKLKDKITNTVLGILLLLGIYVILNTINPQLLEVDPQIDQVKLVAREFEYNEAAFEGDGDYTDGSSPGTWGKGELLPQSPAVYCPGKGGSAEIRRIVESFQNKVTYRFGGKGSNTNFSGKDAGKSCPGGTLCLDCSGFTNQVHRCAGIPRQGGGTANIFGQPGAEPIKTYEEKDGKVIVNGKELKPGDTFGKPSWHIFIYLGEGQFAESTSDRDGRSLNKNIQITTKTLTKTIKRKTGLYLRRV